MRLFFFFNDTATTEIYTLSLHDALPISARGAGASLCGWVRAGGRSVSARRVPAGRPHVQEPPLVGPSDPPPGGVLRGGAARRGPGSPSSPRHARDRDRSPGRARDAPRAWSVRGEGGGGGERA